MKFKCDNCFSVFESEGKKKEWNDPIYGYCWKYIATCPECNEESVEYKKPKPAKKESSAGFTPQSCNGCCQGQCQM